MKPCFSKIDKKHSLSDSRSASVKWNAKKIFFPIACVVGVGLFLGRKRLFTGSSTKLEESEKKLEDSKKDGLEIKESVVPKEVKIENKSGSSEKDPKGNSPDDLDLVENIDPKNINASIDEPEIKDGEKPINTGPSDLVKNPEQVSSVDQSVDQDDDDKDDEDVQIGDMIWGRRQYFRVFGKLPPSSDLPYYPELKTEDREPSQEPRSSDIISPEPKTEPEINEKFEEEPTPQQEAIIGLSAEGLLRSMQNSWEAMSPEKQACKVGYDFIAEDKTGVAKQIKDDLNEVLDNGFHFDILHRPGLFKEELLLRDAEYQTLVGMQSLLNSLTFEGRSKISNFKYKCRDGSLKLVKYDIQLPEGRTELLCEKYFSENYDNCYGFRDDLKPFVHDKLTDEMFDNRKKALLDKLKFQILIKEKKATAAKNLNRYFFSKVNPYSGVPAMNDLLLERRRSLKLA